MRLHLPAVPGQPQTKANSTEAFTNKVVRFAEMMVPRGHEVLIYGDPRADTGATEYVPCYPFSDPQPFTAAAWEPFNEAAAKEIEKRAEPGDVLALIGGTCQASLAAKLPLLRVVEFGIGYPGSFAPYRVFESINERRPVMAQIDRLQAKKRRRAQKMRRQWKKYEATGKQGHLKAFRIHRRAVKKLLRLIDQVSRPSPNFAYAEFNTKDGTPVPESAHKGLDHLCQTYLEPLRAKFGPVSITSGHRHAAYNAAVGGVSNSVHIYDAPGRDGSAVAADVVCARGNPYEWAQFLDHLGAAGVGTYPRHGFVHVDNRDRMGWPKSRWTG